MNCSRTSDHRRHSQNRTSEQSNCCRIVEKKSKIVRMEMSKNKMNKTNRRQAEKRKKRKKKKKKREKERDKSRKKEAHLRNPSPEKLLRQQLIVHSVAVQPRVSQRRRGEHIHIVYAKQDDGKPRVHQSPQRRADVVVKHLTAQAFRIAREPRCRITGKGGQSRGGRAGILAKGTAVRAVS